MICSICLEDTIFRNIFIRTSCNHFYHASCLKNLFKYTKKCPLCRKKLELEYKKILSKKLMYLRKQNVITGAKWTIGVDYDNNIICSLPFWLK